MTQSRPVRSTLVERQADQPATFYRQVVAELRKVVWPTQQQLVTYFIVVLVFVLVIMTIVSLLDLAFGKAGLRGLRLAGAPDGHPAPPGRPARSPSNDEGD